MFLPKVFSRWCFSTPFPLPSARGCVGGEVVKKGRLHNFFSFPNLPEVGKVGNPRVLKTHWFPVAHMHFLPPVASQAQSPGGVFLSLGARLSFATASLRVRLGPVCVLQRGSSWPPLTRGAPACPLSHPEEAAAGTHYLYTLTAGRTRGALRQDSLP